MSGEESDALVARVAAANLVMSRVRDGSTRFSTGTLSAWAAARAELLAAQRELALARGEPACMHIDWTPAWNAGAPCPHVVASGGRTFLIYLARTSTAELPTQEAPRMVRPSDEGGEMLGVVEFTRPYGHRFGGPNDEVLHGHPFADKGLDYYAAHVVRNSPWLATERATNRVHAQFSEARWERLNHYLLAFHDNVFECLAEGFSAELWEMSFSDALRILTERVLGGGGSRWSTSSMPEP